MSRARHRAARDSADPFSFLRAPWSLGNAVYVSPSIPARAPGKREPQKEPALRYKSAIELKDDLDRYLNGTPIHARPVGSVGRVAKWARRRPVVAALGVGVVTRAVFLGGAATQLWQVSEQRDRARSAETETQSLLAESVAGGSTLQADALGKVLTVHPEGSLFMIEGAIRLTRVSTSAGPEGQLATLQKAQAAFNSRSPIQGF